MFALLGIVCFLCKRRALSGRFPCGLAFGSHLWIPRVSAHHHARNATTIASTAGLTFCCWNSTPRWSVKYSYTSSITASCLASLFSNRSNCACSSAIRLCIILPLEVGEIGGKEPAISFNASPMAPHLGRMKINHPPSSPRDGSPLSFRVERRVRRGSR